MSDRTLAAARGASASHDAVLESAGPDLHRLGRLGLTMRQTDVLALLMHGLRNKGIARELGISTETVKDHVAATLHKLQVASRVQAVFAVGACREALLQWDEKRRRMKDRTETRAAMRHFASDGYRTSHEGVAPAGLVAALTVEIRAAAKGSAHPNESRALSQVVRSLISRSERLDAPLRERTRR